MGPAPPAVGVNVKVAETPALPATRSTDSMVNDVESTAPPITPDATEVDAIGSALVCTVTNEPAVGAPMVMPASVTVTEVLAASAVPPVVMMMNVAPGAPGDRLKPLYPAADKVAVGVAVVAKKPEG